MLSSSSVAMVEFYAARGQTAGLVLMALLLAVLLRGLSGNQLKYRILFGASGAFFALLAFGSALEHLHPRWSTAYSGSSFFTYFFGFSALAALWISGLFSEAGRLVKSIGDPAPAGTLRTSRSSLASSAHGKRVNLDHRAPGNPERAGRRTPKPYAWRRAARSARKALAPSTTSSRRSAPSGRRRSSSTSAT